MNFLMLCVEKGWIVYHKYYQPLQVSQHQMAQLFVSTLGMKLATIINCMCHMPHLASMAL